MYRMTFAALSLALFAQTFDPQLPAPVPPVTGEVRELMSVRYIDVVVGTGAPALAGQRYTVHYTGWLRDGKKFDSSVDRQQPFQFVQGRRQVIAGWDGGFEGMKVGGKRRLFLPYQMAYGERGSGPIPPKAELIFDVELLGVGPVAELPAAIDVLVPLADIEGKVLALAKAVPEEKYGWRPAEKVRSFGELFLHLALGNELLLRAAQGLPAADLNKLIAEHQGLEKQAWTKSQLVDRLEKSFAGARRVMESARPGSLMTEMDFFGQTTTRRGILVSLDTHASEHLGQAIAYARMNGIVPPWSR
jgi:peptidylprolyl isomerase